MLDAIMAQRTRSVRQTALCIWHSTNSRLNNANALVMEGYFLERSIAPGSATVVLLDEDFTASEEGTVRAAEAIYNVSTGS